MPRPLVLLALLLLALQGAGAQPTSTAAFDCDRFSANCSLCLDAGGGLCAWRGAHSRSASGLGACALRGPALKVHECVYYLSNCSHCNGLDCDACIDTPGCSFCKSCGDDGVCGDQLSWGANCEEGAKDCEEPPWRPSPWLYIGAAIAAVVIAAAIISVGVYGRCRRTRGLPLCCCGSSD